MSTVTLMALGWPFLATLPAAFLITGVTSVAFERSLFRRLYRASDLQQVLLTLGLVFISVAAAAWFYGTMQQPIRLPAYLRTYATVGGINLSIYRLFLIAVALAVTVVLVAALEYTRFGAQVRAAVDNQRMAQGLGINVDWCSPSRSRSAADSRGLVVRWRSTLLASIRTLHSPI